MDREGGGAAHDQDAAIQAVRLEAALDGLDLLVHRGSGSFAFFHTALVAVAVVAVHPSHGNAGQGVPLPVHGFHLIQGHTGAVLAHVHVHQHVGPAGLAQQTDLLGVIPNGKELHLGEGLLQSGKPPDVGPHQGVGQGNALGPGLGGHLCLCDGGALEAVDASLQLHLHHLGHLVGLDVGPQAVCTPGNGDHLLDVLADQCRVVHQLGACQVLLALKGVKACAALIHTPPTSRSLQQCCPGRNWCPWQYGQADPSPRQTAQTAGWSRR